LGGYPDEGMMNLEVEPIGPVGVSAERKMKKYGMVIEKQMIIMS
jgi:hypothetical protein